jgi:ParB family transcriptional regulator, chromosome partitioning protein
MSKMVLGRGLGALIPTDAPSTTPDTMFRMVPLDKVAPNPMQPRRTFDEESLLSLSESLKVHGMMQPLVVTQNGTGFSLVAGERRYRAATMAGFTEVPVILFGDIDDTRRLEMALVENIQRENLNPLETAEAYRTLIDTCGLTQAQLSERVGKSRTAVTNYLRMLTLPEAIKQFIRDGKLTEGHARAILAADGSEAMLRLADRILTDSMSVRGAEAEAKRTKKRRLVPKKLLPAIRDVETYIQQTLATSVKIHPGLKRGRIEIEYYGEDDLDRLLQLFKRISAKSWDQSAM